MSALWAWLVSSISELLAGESALRLAMGIAAVASGLALLLALAGRRRRRRAGARTLQSAEGTGAVHHVDVTTPRSTPGSIPAPILASVSEPAHVEGAVERLGAPERRPVSLPLHAGSAGPTRESPEWRVASGPLGASRGAAAVATVPLAPARSVAVAERPLSPLPISAEAELGTPTAARSDAPAAAPAGGDDALARAEYQRGLKLLAEGELSRVQALHEALACFRRAQEIWTRERTPERWAAIQNDIGRVYQEMPEGDRVAHVRTAIMHHQSALDLFDPVQHPMNWAWTQSALGAAYQSLPSGSVMTNARAAVAYHQRALDVFTRDNAPLAWAWNMNNLAAAYEMMPGGADGERVAHLRDAAECYAAALEVYTAEDYPVQHQVVARNLARVRSELKALD